MTPVRSIFPSKYIFCVSCVSGCVRVCVLVCVRVSFCLLVCVPSLLPKYIFGRFVCSCVFGSFFLCAGVFFCQFRFFPFFGRFACSCVLRSLFLCAHVCWGLSCQFPFFYFVFLSFFWPLCVLVCVGVSLVSFRTIPQVGRSPVSPHPTHPTTFRGNF